MTLLFITITSSWLAALFPSRSLNHHLAIPSVFSPFLSDHLHRLVFFLRPPFSVFYLSIPPSISPMSNWWCVEARQTDGGWGIAPASLWHWAPFRPQKWSMLNLILNTPSLTPADRRKVETNVWQHSWGNLISPTVEVYLQVCLCACLCLCGLPSHLKRLSWHMNHLSCTLRGVGGRD